ncbi:MAG: DNA repair protein rad52 [Lichina confinis]|nr:MAG: DNA repair protein rad52 [Lichina confinis]
MPSPGDQHKANPTITNPFSETECRISEFTAQEIATLSSRLEKQLGPEFISTRPGAAGQRVHYVAAEKCINLANEIFGFNGWSSSIKNIQIDFVDESQGSGRVSLGLSVIVRVTLRDGTYHEVVLSDGCFEGKAAAFEKAKKEGTTDALKRTLRNFGNVLGNCIYDKDYLARVSKVKVAPSKWDVQNLHRHPDYAPVKKGLEVEPAQNRIDPQSEDFDEADFNEGHLREHPDEIILDQSVAPRHAVGQGNSDGFGARQPNGPVAPPDPAHAKNGRPVSGATSAAPNHQPPGQPQHGGHQAMANVPAQPRTPVHGQRMSNPMPPRQYVGPTHSTGAPQQRAAQQLPSAPRNGMGSATNKPHFQQQSHMPANTRAPAPAPHPQPQHGMHQSRAGNNAQQEPPQHIDPPVGFYPAGAAQMLQETPALVASKVPTFNPHAESPSIRKTSGVDHSRSKPVNKDLLGALHTAAATGGGGPSAGLGQSHQHQHQQQSIPPRIGANITNPQLDTARRIGMPNSPSPMHGRPPYKPPGPATNGKRSLEGVSIPQPRPPLNDISVNSAGATDAVLSSSAIKGIIPAANAAHEVEQGVEQEVEEEE